MSYATVAELVKLPVLQAKLQVFSVCCNSVAAVSENLSIRCAIGSFPAFRVIVDGQKPWGSLCKTECYQLQQRHFESRLEQQWKLEHLHQNWHWLKCRKVSEGSAGSKESDKQNLAFRMECRAFLAAVVQKLLNKSPLNYSLAKALGAFDPQRMADSSCHKVNRSHLRIILKHMIEAGRVSETDADLVH